MIYIKFVIVFVVWSVWLKAVFELFFSANSLSKFLMISAFFAPFYSVSFALFGFQFSIYKLIIPMFFLYVLLFYKSIHKNILIISTYFFVISLFSYMYALHNNYFDMIIDFGRVSSSAYTQPIVQGLLFIITICAPWMIKKNTSVNIFKVFSFYIYGCVWLVLLGWIQILFYNLGLPWFDWWFLFDAFSRSAETGLYVYANERGFYRMSSLGGEPRHFAAFVVLSIILLLWLRKNSPNHMPYIHGSFGYVILGLLLSGAFCSLSSSALLSLIIGIFIYYTFQSRILLFLSAFFVVLLLLLFNLFNFEIGYGVLRGGEIVGEHSVISKILWKLQSIDMMLYAAPKDAFAIRAIFNDFGHFLIGYGINMADLYVPELALSYDTPFGEVNRYNKSAPLQSSHVPTSGILQIILNGGVVGAGLLILLLFKTCISLDKSIFVLILTVLFMITISSSVIFTMGLLFISLLICHGKIQKLSIVKP